MATATTWTDQRADALRVADGLELSIDYVTKVCAILAQRRKGKTYTASVIAEELVRLGQPWAALDPTGAWWGLRSSADGLAPGLPVVVLGGQHGHLPLTRDMGRAVADLVLDQPGWYVLDLSLFDSRSAEREFAYDFADRLYRRKGEAGMDFPFHLFVDEADLFVPQEKETGDQRVLGAFQAIVRRGGIRGLGVTLISQRPALVNKSALTQLDILVLLRLVAGQDQDAVHDNYLKRALDKTLAQEAMAALATLRLGEALLLEPGAEPLLFERRQINQRATFNSSATPKAGEKRVEPRAFADVDLSTLEQSLAVEIERAQHDDPKWLRRRIAELEAQLRDVEPDVREVKVEVDKLVIPDVLPGQIDELDGLLEQVGNVARRMRNVVANVAAFDMDGRHLDDNRMVAVSVTAPDDATSEGTFERTIQAPISPKPQVTAPPRRDTRRDTSPPGISPGISATRNAHLTGPQQRVLDAVAWFESLRFGSITKSQVGFIAGYRVGKKVGGTFGNILGELRSRGLIDYPAQGLVCLTADGRAAANAPAYPPTTEQLQAAIMDKLDGPERRVLQVIIDGHPHQMAKQDVGERAGYTVGAKIGGTFGNILGRLRSLGLIDYPAQGYVVATPVLFV